MHDRRGGADGAADVIDAVGTGAARIGVERVALREAETERSIACEDVVIADRWVAVEVEPSAIVATATAVLEASVLRTQVETLGRVGAPLARRRADLERQNSLHVQFVGTETRSIGEERTIVDSARCAVPGVADRGAFAGRGVRDEPSAVSARFAAVRRVWVARPTECCCAGRETETDAVVEFETS